MRPDENDDLFFDLVLVERLICFAFAFSLLLALTAGAHRRYWLPHAVGFLVATLVLMVTWAIADYHHYLARHGAPSAVRWLMGHWAFHPTRHHH